ncbi:MAG: phosphotransferase [Rubrivivax sp.]|nr:phosphotransferase [Rubrivivax sp.]
MRGTPDPVGWPDAARQAAFERWIAAVAPEHGIQIDSLAPASADASFRRYLRVAATRAPGGSLIVMDAPPPLEDVRPFVHVAGLIAAAGLHAPRVLAADPAQGFLLLTDLGSRLLLDALLEGDAAAADRRMRPALHALVRWQQGVDAAALPAWGEAQIRAELALFPEWCVQREFGIAWRAAEQAAWARVCDAIVANALAQPAVAVHADWMPRNLMLAGDDPAAEPGILDFQDAVRGPITYDLVSLLRDAFVSWDEEQQIDWAVRWWEQARRAGLPVDADFGEFWRALEWTGLQRHLRILGVFCRLKHRDAKPRYAQDLPRFFGYATKVAMRYAPLAPLARLLEPMSGQRVLAGHTF